MSLLTDVESMEHEEKEFVFGVFQHFPSDPNWGRPEKEEIENILDGPFSVSKLILQANDTNY